MVLSYLSNLNPEERERFFQRLDHELRGPLRKINTFCGFICEDEKEYNPKVLLPLRELADLAVGISVKLNSLARAKNETELQANLSEMEGLIDKCSGLFPEDHHFTNQDSLDNARRISLLLRRVDYTYRTFFNLGPSEHFSFRAYLKLFPFLNQAVLDEKKISFSDKTESFPFETESRDYELVMNNLLGNAITHGFPASLIVEDNREISIITRGNYTPYLVRVANNGVSIDTDRISRQSVERGLVAASDLEKPLADLESFIEQKGLYIPKTPEQYSGLVEKERRGFLLNQLIFLPKVTTSESGAETVHGTAQGIGLDLVKSLVEKNGGTVWVRSRLGDTRFYFTLPPEKVVNYRP